MWLIDNLGQAFEQIAAAKLRAFLTALGIIIGIGAVITMLAISQGVRTTVIDAFSDLGANIVTVFPGAPVQPGSQGGGFTGGAGGPVASTLTLEDAEALRGVAGVRTVAPVIIVPVMAVAGAESLPLAATGTAPSYAEMVGYELAEGRLFEEGVGEAVLNESAAARFFPDGAAVGGEIRINQEPFTVVGVLQNLESPFQQGGGAFGGSNGGQQDAQQARPAILVPVERALEISDIRFVSQILLTVDSPEVVEQVAAEGRELLVARHDGVQDFRIVSAQQLLSGFTTIFDILTVGLAAIAGISLLVGGIGIMNIMLVSVTERTREIGLAKAIGATRGQVVLQFLTEAVILSLLGGVLGLALAWAGSLAVREWLDVPTLITPMAVALAVGVSAAIGLFFGVAPAWRAARLDPIVALRHE
jgi:putative ABC transport system permease protein